MKFNTDALLNWLEKEDAQTILDSFTNSFNEAVKLKAEKEKKAKEAEMKAKVFAAKKADAAKIEQAIADYIAKYYPDFGSFKISDKEIEQFIAGIDTIYEEVKNLTKPTKDAPKGDPIKEFLRQYNL